MKLPRNCLSESYDHDTECSNRAPGWMRAEKYSTHTPRARAAASERAPRGDLPQRALQPVLTQAQWAWEGRGGAAYDKSRP